jgi:hypothetical protein
MATITPLYVNNVAPTLAPKPFSPVNYPVTDGEMRGADATMNITLKSNKYKLALEWSTIDGSMAPFITLLLSDVNFDVQFMTPETGGLVAKHMYRSEIEMGTWVEGANVPTWQDFKVTFIER